MKISQAAWRVRWTAAKGIPAGEDLRDLAQAQRSQRRHGEAGRFKQRDIVTRRNGLFGYGVVAFGIDSGLRLSEIRGAPKKNFDLDKKTYRVDQRADENGEIGVPKSLSGRRTVDISEDLIPILRELKELNPDSDLMFPSEVGTPFSGSNFYKRYWIPLLKAVGLAWDGEEVDEDGTITKFGFHYLRHYHASRCLENGMDMKTLSVHMGHSSYTVTADLYLHLFEDIEAEKKRRDLSRAKPKPDDVDDD